MTGAPLLEVRNVSKYFGNVVALKDISVGVGAGEVTCVLGDNGAGKSTFIKILSGVHKHDEGQFLVEGKEVHFSSPRDAKAAGIATVYQDLAMAPLMSIWRNFFLGSEPTKGWGPFERFDVAKAKEIAVAEIAKMGIEAELRDVSSRELYDADELIAVTTAGGVTPINTLDGEKIGNGEPGPLTVEIRDRFWALMDEPGPLIEAIQY